MDRRFITVVLVAISLALVGLVAMQVIWVRKTIDLREMQFSEGLDHALLTVSDHMERMERLQDLKRNRKGRRLLARLDSLRQSSELATQSGNSEASTLVIPDDLTGSSTWTEHRQADRAENEELVSDLVRTILANELRRSIQQRVDPMLLDSLLHAELSGLGIADTPTWGVYTGHGEWVKLPRSERDTTGLWVGGTAVRLFRHDIAGPAYFLHVHADHARSALLAGLGPMLIASGLFVLVIAVAFIFTMRTMLRQKRLNDIRTDLVNNLTHELKTPISTIGLACEALADPSIPRTEEQIRGYTTMIRDENKRLGSLVENVLLSAVQDSGSMVLKAVDLDLHALINDVVRSSSMLVSRRAGRIDTDLTAEIHRLKADRIHLTNLLYNLIDNAVKYCEQEPRIRIATRSDDTGIHLSVVDNGIGIAPSEQRKVFDRLYRVPTGNLHNAKGFGLGLSYVKNVVERHGGRIRLESRPGSGSTFHIFLPFEHEHAHQAPRRRG